jgi:hypothetical protein
VVLVYVIHLHYETWNIPKWVPFWGPRVLINLDGWMDGWMDRRGRDRWRRGRHTTTTTRDDDDDDDDDGDDGDDDETDVETAWTRTGDDEF